MKRLNLAFLSVLLMGVIVLPGCSKDNTEPEAQFKEAVVQVELRFSENYAFYTWSMGFQLVSSSSNVTVSGYQWEETIHPAEFATWLNATGARLTSNHYWMETSQKVSEMTFSGIAELVDEGGDSGGLEVTLSVYADGELVKAENVVFGPSESTT